MFCEKRTILILIVWVWLFLGMPLTAILLAYIKGLEPNINGVINMLSSEPYLSSYLEFICAGGLPLAITLLCRENFSIYGLRRKNLRKSVILSLIYAAFILIPKIIYGNFRYTSFKLPFPLNLWYAFLSILSYGPLEIFFITWLIVNMDCVFNSLEKIISPGLIITILVFGLSHVVFARGGIVNAISVTINFFVLGLIFKYTGNSIGPMISWTITNGYIIYLVAGCLI